jgi:hypothetical protein
MAGTKIISPQEGYQMKALSSSADIVIGGGAAGVGKTFCLLLEPLRHINNPNFGGVIFRRTKPQIRAEGGLWDASYKLYTEVNNTIPKESVLEWHFEEGSKIKFSHLEHEKNIYDWQGSEIPFIGFDELTHFSKKMFFYLLTRNRSTCGVKPYVRATCNPDPDSWVSEFIKWWIDEETGFPIKEREGIVRYFVVDNNEYIWGESVDDVYKKAEYMLKPLVESSGIGKEFFIKSVTFVGGSIYDNKELLKIDPAYLGNLNSQDQETKEQLLKGNWKVSISDIDLYDYYKFQDIFSNTQNQPTGRKYITCDIALKGSDKLVIFVWDGRVLIDFTIMNKSKGNEVINAINKMKNNHGVPNSRIVFDNDGVGGFVDGFIEGAIEFKNGSKAANDENYSNKKTQCFYKSSDNIEKYYIPDEVANRMYDSKMTLRQRLIYERKAIKKHKKDSDGKLQIIDKTEQKVYLNGESPDLLDAFMMREVFELEGKPIARINW